MEHYVTLFDSLFLPQGLTLVRSMDRNLGSFTLWVLCMDDEVFKILEKISHSRIRLLRISALETESLLEVKQKRSKGEYCWTLTPFAPGFVFDADQSIRRVTYIDADMWFRKNPLPIFREFEKSGKAVLITDHNYDPHHDQSEISGRFCVQFIIFNRNGTDEIRKWWSDRCLEWCYAKAHEGKFGDQKYLDDWPILFPDSIHVLNNQEWLLAPWNANRFPYGNSICWHFHGLRIGHANFRAMKAYLGSYFLPKVVINCIYKPYLADMRISIDLLKNNHHKISNQINLSFMFHIKRFTREFLNHIKFSSNVIKLD